MLLISNIKTPLGSDEQAAVEKALQTLHLKPTQVKEAYVSKSSLDARHQSDIRLVSTVAVRLYAGEEKLAARLTGARSCPCAAARQSPHESVHTW